MRNFILFILSITFFSFFSNAQTRQVPSSTPEVMFSYSPLVKKASPAVVNIYTKKKVTYKNNFSPFFNDPFFQHFFGKSHNGGRSRQRVESSLGSGVIVGEDGLIVTNNHVINGSDEINVVLSDRREFKAKIVKIDEESDVALLKIETSNTKDKFSYLKLSDSDDLEVGDIVLAIGNPFGVGQTVTNGIVSASARSNSPLLNGKVFIQTDAAINPGNSGGALIDMRGDLVGLNSAIFSKSGGSNGIGFAIPSNLLKSIIDAKGKNVKKPWLGVKAQQVDAEIAKSIDLATPMGVIINKIHSKSPAKKAGIKIGDVITKLDNKEIYDPATLNYRINTYKTNDIIDFTVQRAGKEKVYKVKIISPPKYPQPDKKVIKKGQFAGIEVANLSPYLAQEIGVDMNLTGVIVTKVKKKSGWSSRSAFDVNDVILSINGINIDSTKKLLSTLKKQNGVLKVEINRDGVNMNKTWYSR